MAHNHLYISPAVLLTFSCALWGGATVISKALLASVPPITFLFIQLVPSVCLLWLLVLATRQSIPRNLLPLAMLGLLNPGFSYTLSMLGLTKTTASVATLLWAAEPALIVLTAGLLRQETVTVGFLAATAAAICGVTLVSGLTFGDGLASPDAAGSALILGGVFFCALYTVLSRRIAPDVEPLPAVAVQQSAGLLWVLAIIPFELQGSDSTTLSARELLGGALSGIMYYAAAFWCYFTALRTVPATTASIYINLTPVFGIAAAYAFLGERLTGIQWLGACIVLISVMTLLALAKKTSPRSTLTGTAASP